MPDLNAAIQSARNTTFALQNEKARIINFDAWYKPWQDALRADPILKWLNEARVRIVHKGDIEANSTTIIWLIFDYFDAASEVLSDLRGDRAVVPQPQLSVPSLTPAENFVALLRDSGIPEPLIQEATISYERRWEDALLPGRELNAALAHGYAVLANLLVSAHETVEASCAHEYGCEDRPPLGILTTIVKPPTCMATTRKFRTKTLEAHSGLDSKKGIVSAGEVDWDSSDDVLDRYVDEDGRRITLTPLKAQTIFDLLPMQIEKGKAILRSGEEHGWHIFFYRSTTVVGYRSLVSENAQQKREISKEVAQLALEYEATGVLEVGEAWMSPAPSSDEFVRPAFHPEREEALVFAVSSIGGREIQAIVPFTRPDGVGGDVQFGETQIVEDAQNNFLAPLRAMWNWQKENYPSPPGASFFKKRP